MSPAEKVEVAGIVVVVGVIAALRTHLPARIELGDVVLGAAALLLVQGLVRDLARLRAARRLAAQSPRKVTCMCAESTIGATAIFAGLILVFVATPVVLRPPAFVWPVAVAAVMVFGFLTRSLVLDWREKRFRWETDHNVNVAWRK
jgi:hypothetical protein